MVDRAEVEEWESKTSFFKDEELTEALNREDVYLPATDGYQFKALLTSEDELVKFICKFDSPIPWDEVGLIKFVEDEKMKKEAEEVGWEYDFYYTPTEMIGKVFSYNQFFKDGQRVQCSERTWEGFLAKDFKVVKKFQYPILISYFCDDSFDRFGNVTTRMIDVTELGSIKENTIYG